MPKLKDQNGFAAVEAVLVVLLLAAIGAAGYFAYKDHQNTSAKTASSTTQTTGSTKASSTAVQQSSPYTGWKTYTSSYQHVSFQYPTSWTLQTQADANVTDGSGQDATLTSPNGVTITYLDEVSGLGGACAPGGPDVSLTGVQQVTSANGPHPIYLVQSGDELGLDNEDPAPSVGDVGECMFYPLIASAIHAGEQISFATNLQFSAGTPQSTAANQASDFTDAKLILESFKYLQ